MREGEQAKSICILLSGKAGVGKTTSSTILKDLYSKRGLKAESFSFATGVKIVASQMGWDRVKDFKGRRLLQEIGKLGREYDENCWANWTFNRIIPNNKDYPLDVVLIDDWRFVNEGNFVRNDPLYQVFDIRVYAPDRETLKNTEHYYDISETSLPELGSTEANYFSFIDNRGTMDELYEECGKLVAKIEPEIIRW